MKFSLSVSALAALTAPFTNGAATPSNVQADLSFAYEYLYPLYAYGMVAKPLPEIARPNMMLHAVGLNEPGAIGVVRPNADTIYSVLLFDLSHEDLVVEVPEVPGDRYWVFPIVTPYGDHLVNLGNLNETPAGRYLITYSPNGQYGLETGDCVPAGFVGRIKYPMAYGISNMRILANRTDEDIAAVQELQQGFKTFPVPREGEPIAPRLDLAMFNETQYNDGHDVGEGYYQDVLRVAARLEPYCPTYVVQDRAWVGERLRNAGFNGEQWTQPLGTNLTAASNQANVSSLAFMETVSKDMGNGWIIIDEDYFGFYGSAYNARYAAASVGYLGLTSDQSVYPFNPQELDLEVGQAVMFTFTEPPRIKDGGFWSLTAYNPQQDLIENDEEQYSLGDQTGLTFPDGSPVTQDSEQKVFQILLQANDIPPPSNWTSNWLPLNNDGGKISTTRKHTVDSLRYYMANSSSVRWYGAEDYMTDGSYVYPKIDIIDAVTE